ncbi:hypothetical protein B0A55_12317, partial [Friedmanniomyces simplex]
MARPNPGAGSQPPVSFKTVPGRNRTQKWQQAKTYNYDGDDWGGYDPYDEYGGYDEPESAHSPAPAPAPPMPSYAQQRPQRQNSFDAGDDGTRRQFSGPHPTSQMGYAAEERRGSPSVMPSGGIGRPSGDYARLPPSRGSNDNDYDRRARERNFTNPEQVPPPLNTHSSPVRGPQTAGGFPPRKSSIGQSSTSSGRSAALEPMSAPAGKSVDKPLPFIRPSDIYRRMAEEREREGTSMDGSRPSMDSVQRSAASPPGSASGMTGATPAFPPDRRPSLEPVAERREREQKPQIAAPVSRPGTSDLASRPAADMQQEAEYQPLSSLQTTSGESFGEPSEHTAGKQVSPTLPAVTRFSGFGSDFIHGGAAGDRPSGSDGLTPSTSPPGGFAQSTIARVLGAPLMNPDGGTQESTGPAPYAAPSQYSDAISTDLQHRPSGASTGFRSVVHTAFDRHSDTSSNPVSPVSRDESYSHSAEGQGSNSGGMSRSDTTSTAGISPIMSRVPSAATAQQRHLQQERDVPTPIAEEPASTRTPTQSRHTSGNYLPGTLHGQQQAHAVIARKPSPSPSTPSHSRNVSAADTGSGTGTGTPTTLVQPGYRRSLDPPSNGSSPARTPGVEDSAMDRRLSAPLAAGMGHAEAPDVGDQAAEVPRAVLESVETPAGERGEGFESREERGLDDAGAGEAGGVGEYEAGGPRSVDASPEGLSYSPQRGGDYSARESNLARSVNASPPYSPTTAQRAGDYSTREADLAHSVNASPTKPS